ncbi:hypothetical protein MPSEU_001004500 [Mayamaea pseudoterrestris]|nr:hypothetical protein MPSEU_001004500 [Mayamaea pseudoterrestris]
MTKIEISQSDKRIYEHVTLSNGLSCLLISDSETDKAAASVAVAVGQMQDELPGLAHLTEHMLFMGSERYPDENAHESYLAANGGHSNAYTDLELTCYYLDVQSSALDGALDRFSSFFYCPLLKESSIDKEINAVDSEHRNNTLADHWRIHQLARTVLGESSNHPYAMFGSGNRESLAAHGILKLRESVKAFYDQYYKAINMTLCIVGKQPIDELKAMAEKYFTSIPSGDASHKPRHVAAIQPNPLRLNMVPTSDSINLQLQWCMRETLSLYKTKPSRYLSHLIGHEGPGSLLAALRAKGWAQELGADDMSRCFREFTVFAIDIELTEQGLENVQGVVAMVYAYLSLLQEVPQYVHDELLATSDMQFRFLSKRPASDTASTLAAQMHLFPPQFCVSGPYKYFEFDPVLIEECRTSLTPENMLMIVASKDFAGSTDETDQWYGTQFKRVSFDADFLQNLNDPSKIKESFGDLHLPLLNDMLATNFELVQRSPAFIQKDCVPCCLLDSATCRLWYKPDTMFDMPKVNIMMFLRTPTAYACGPMHSVLASLWVELSREECNEFTYAASMAGLHCDFANTRGGVEIHLSGYNHKAINLLQRVVNVIQSLTDKLTDELFHRIVDKLRRQFLAFFVSQPYEQAIYAADLCLEDTKWEMTKRMEALEDVSPAELKHFSKELVSRFKLELLVHGNVSCEEATALSDIVLSEFTTKAPFHLPTNRVTELPTDCLYRLRNLNEDDENSCALAIFQMGPMDYRSNGTLSLLHHLLREPAFNQLRTEEQLGYIVHSSIKTSGDRVKSLMILVQGGSFDPVHMDGRIEHFLVTVRQQIVALSAEEFQTNVKSVCEGLREKNKSLGEESSKHWSAITSQRYDFRRLALIADEVEALSKLDVLRLFDRYLVAGSPNRRKLSVQVFGREHTDAFKLPPASTVECINDPRTFVGCQPLFPVQPLAEIKEFTISEKIDIE